MRHTSFKLIHIFFILFSCVLISACAAKGKAEGKKSSIYVLEKHPPQWTDLIQRLKADNVAPGKLDQYIQELDQYNPSPMTTKIKELYSIAFVPKEPGKKGPKRIIYPNIVSEKTIALGRKYLEEHKAAFSSMEKEYNVPKEIVAALLYVETRHGQYIGKDNAFITLASMASANTPSKVLPYLDSITIQESQIPWLQQKLTERSDWAYKELKHLLDYCAANNIDPLSVQGSIYGAIGYSQFMPSNIPLFAKDGDKDGYINLFHHPDAIHSVANYLAKNGWKGNMSYEDQRKALRRYNNLTIYANSIMTLAASIKDNKVYSAPFDILAKESGKKTPQKEVQASSASQKTKKGTGKSVSSQKKGEKSLGSKNVSPKKASAQAKSAKKLNTPSKTEKKGNSSAKTVKKNAKKKSNSTKSTSATKQKQ